MVAAGAIVGGGDRTLLRGRPAASINSPIDCSSSSMRWPISSMREVMLRPRSLKRVCWNHRGASRVRRMMAQWCSAFHLRFETLNVPFVAADLPPIWTGPLESWVFCLPPRGRAVPRWCPPWMTLVLWQRDWRENRRFDIFKTVFARRRLHVLAQSLRLTLRFNDQLKDDLQ